MNSLSSHLPNDSCLCDQMWRVKSIKISQTDVIASVAAPSFLAAATTAAAASMVIMMGFTPLTLATSFLFTSATAAALKTTATPTLLAAATAAASSSMVI